MVGLAVGGAVGGLGLVTLFAALVCAIKRRKKLPLPTEETGGTQNETSINTEVRKVTFSVCLIHLIKCFFHFLPPVILVAGRYLKGVGIPGSVYVQRKWVSQRAYVGVGLSGRGGCMSRGWVSQRGQWVGTYLYWYLHLVVATRTRMVGKRAVRIVLECSLV